MIEPTVRPHAWEREVDVEDAIAAIASGSAVIVVDEEATPPHGTLVIASEAMTDEWMNVFVRRTTGVIRVVASAARLRALGLAEPGGSVSLQEAPPAASAKGRAATIRALARPDRGIDAFASPGHVLVVQALQPGVLQRPAVTEAALDLMQLAGLQPAAALSEVCGADRGELADPHQLAALAAELDIPTLAVADVVRHELERRGLIERVIETTMPTRAGSFRCVAYRSVFDDGEHLALIVGDVTGDQPVLTRVQRSFPLDELLVTGGGERCSQLEHSMARMAQEGAGVLVYLRPYPDIGVGLVRELEDTAARREAQPARPYLGYDERQHGVAAQILRDLGLRQLRMLTDHPGRHRGLRGFGLEVVEYVPMTDGEPR